MAKKLSQFVKLDDFSIDVPTNSGEPRKIISPSGIYIHGDYSNTWIQYAGEDAGESFAEMVLPTDSTFLRKFAEGILEYTEKVKEYGK